jgi:hypothetical protein
MNRIRSGKIWPECVRFKRHAVRSIRKLRPAGAGYGFCQDGMNFVQKATGLHALGKQRSVVTVQARTLYEGADFKIKLIVYFLGHGFHFMYHNRCSVFDQNN